MADLQELFARLQSSKPADGNNQQTNTNTSYHQPSVSSPIYSPTPGGPQPHHSSAILVCLPDEFYDPQSLDYSTECLTNFTS
jgi:hypothetical protein